MCLRDWIGHRRARLVPPETVQGIRRLLWWWSEALWVVAELMLLAALPVGLLAYRHLYAVLVVSVLCWVLADWLMAFAKEGSRHD